MLEESGPNGTISYAYDPVGNRTSKTKGSTVTSSVYDLDDRNTAYTYDADGNVLDDGTNHCWYDEANELVGSAATGATSPTTTYSYNGDGIRVQQASSSSTTNYVIDSSLPYASVAEDRDGSNNLLARYISGDDLIRMDRGGVSSYYLFDGLGSTRQLANASGTVTDSYSYDSFGNLTSSPQPTPNPYLFDGQDMDGATGLIYLRDRYMDPLDGRFLSQYPLLGKNDDPISLHRYLYASDDPVCMVDPGGREAGGVGEEFEVVVDEDSLEGSSASVAMEAEDFVADMSAALNEGVPFSDLSPTETGQFFQWLGQMAQQFMDNALEECLPDDAEIETTVEQSTDEYGRSLIDRKITCDGETLNIESKYSLPRGSGSSLTRLVKQVSNSVLTSQGRTLLWTLAEPSPAQITLVTNALGDTGVSVDFVSGVQGLIDYVSAFFGT